MRITKRDARKITSLFVIVMSILGYTFFKWVYPSIKFFLENDLKILIMPDVNVKTMSHFLRKCVLEKEIYIVDLEPFRDPQQLLSNATNNINQIAKATNTTGVIYKNEIESMNKQIEKLSKEIWDIHSLLLNKSKESSGDQYGNYKNTYNKINSKFGNRLYN